jgi:D-alanyl-D-alanine carboxypeptidase
VPQSRRPRKRYRYRLRRLTPVGIVIVAAGLGGAWVGSQRPSTPIAASASPAVPHVVRIPVAPGKQAVAAPVRLLQGGSLVRHAFAPDLLGAAAVLVDAKTGRVLWAKNAHERRHVASTTKIMTALLALRKLQPHDVVTVDKSVPRVPLVREGLRAGEQVEA